MLRRSLTFSATWKKKHQLHTKKKKGEKVVFNTPLSLAKRIQSELAREGTFQQTVRPCAVRLLFHQAHQDPVLSRLHPVAFVACVNRSLACLAGAIPGGKKRPITMPMMRVFLDQDEAPLSKTKKLITNYSVKTDRNYFSLRSEYNASGAQKAGCFYDHLTKDWNLCRDIENHERRIATIYTLVSTVGFKHAYTEAQVAEAKRRVAGKSERFVRTFAYAKSREEYSRRRLLTDASLQQILKDAEQPDMRKVAWILFFDSTYQRFPRRPKKLPSSHMLVLWREWLGNPAARSMPFMERFVSLMSRPDLPKLLEEARAKGDAKFRERAHKKMARFEHRQEKSLVVERSVYDASKEMAKKKLSLSALAYNLQYQRMASVALSSEPTYVAALKTSKAFRAPACAKLLELSHSDSCDKGFSYASHEL